MNQICDRQLSEATAALRESKKQIRLLKSTLKQHRELMDYISTRCGGETLGDTLIRLAGICRSLSANKEWVDWLQECGERLNSYQSPRNRRSNRRRPHRRL